MAKSPNIGLHLTAINDTDKTFLDYRNELSGTDADSNMMILDKAVGDAQKAIISNKQGSDSRFSSIDNNISRLQQQLTSPFNFKGTVADMAALNAIKNPAQNDTYYVISEKCRYSWTWSVWQQSSMEESKYADELADLKSAFKDADNTIARKMILVESDNKWNPSKQVTGVIIANGTVYPSYTDYCYLSDPVPVSEGDVVRVYIENGGFDSRLIRWLCAYDANMNVVPSAGLSSGAYSYTVPNGIKYVQPTVTLTNNTDYMLVINEEATELKAYFEPYYKAGEGFHTDISINDDTDFDYVYLDYSMVNRLNPEECEIGKFINANGSISDNSNYFVSNYLEINSGETLYLYDDSLDRSGHRAFCYFNANKNVVAGGSNTDSTDGIPYVDGVAYVRISCLYRTTDNYQPQHFMVVATTTPNAFVEYGNAPVFKEKYIPNKKENLHVYLPAEIPVGIGRTIELYNELVCLESNKYHLHYSCSIGVQYTRKFSITGTTAGNYTLKLHIFNDNYEQVWTGTSTVKVIANSIASELKILPIGDSLTNLKPWLAEVQTLSNSKIKYIGTRGQSGSTIRHEGRSGLTAIGYNEQFNYTFDENYQGNTNVSGAVNPFWDGSKFSLSYYNTQQAGTVGTADAIQLFLGTNDVFRNYSAEESAQHIKDLVEAIRAEYANIPIFVCNTIYRSNQSGYYSSGGQGFTSASGWAFDSDMKIMNFQNALADALDGYSNVYIVPLSVCMDRENDFGQVEVAVNPRLTTVTETIPNESVHPQNAGYMQIADVMYSSYIAHLS